MAENELEDLNPFPSNAAWHDVRLVGTLWNIAKRCAPLSVHVGNFYISKMFFSEKKSLKNVLGHLAKWGFFLFLERGQMYLDTVPEEEYNAFVVFLNEFQALKEANFHDYAILLYGLTQRNVERLPSSVFEDLRSHVRTSLEQPASLARAELCRDYCTIENRYETMIKLQTMLKNPHVTSDYRQYAMVYFSIAYALETGISQIRFYLMFNEESVKKLYSIVNHSDVQALESTRPEYKVLEMLRAYVHLYRCLGNTGADDDVTLYEELTKRYPVFKRYVNDLVLGLGYTHKAIRVFHSMLDVDSGAYRRPRKEIHVKTRVVLFSLPSEIFCTLYHQIRTYKIDRAYLKRVHEYSDEDVHELRLKQKSLLTFLRQMTLLTQKFLFFMPYDLSKTYTYEEFRATYDGKPSDMPHVNDEIH